MSEKITLKQLLDENIRLFFFKKNIDKMKAKLAIEEANMNFLTTEYHEQLMRYKVQEGLPLDKDVNLTTGKPVE